MQVRHPARDSSSAARSVTPWPETLSAAGFAIWCATVSSVFLPARTS
jgi:hypothetical protein